VYWFYTAWRSVVSVSARLALDITGYHRVSPEVPNEFLNTAQNAVPRRATVCAMSNLTVAALFAARTD